MAKLLYLRGGAQKMGGGDSTEKRDYLEDPVTVYIEEVKRASEMASTSRNFLQVSHSLRAIMCSD